MKATRKLIPALAMLIVAAVVMSTASFAWFTMSREVTAQNMRVNVVAPDNLLITGSADAGAYSATGLAAANITAAAATLKPASTIDGLNFFYLNENSSADAATGALITSSTLSAINGTTSAAGTVAGSSYYKDFVFNLKTDSTTNDVDVYVKTITWTKNSETASIVPARFAILNGAEKMPTSGAISDAGTISACDNTYLFDAGTNKVAGVNQTVGKAIKAADKSTDTVTYAAAGSSTNTLFTVPKQDTTATGTENTTIVVRIWFEGEDTQCTAALAANADLSLSIVLADASYTG